MPPEIKRESFLERHLHRTNLRRKGKKQKSSVKGQDRRTLMNNRKQHHSLILGICNKIASTTLAFAVLLVLAFFATRSAQAQTLTVLHTFTGSPHDGTMPVGNTLLDVYGSLYGTTFYGGAYGSVNGYGTVFKLDRNRKETGSCPRFS
jgi:hypothetical protein